MAIFARNSAGGRAVAEVSESAGIKRQDILDMSLVGNTCMHHIFLNVNPRYIGLSPFPPSLHHSLDIKARDWGLKMPPEVETGDKGTYPPCQVACPAGVNGQDFLYLIAQGKLMRPLKWFGLLFPLLEFLAGSALTPASLSAKGGRSKNLFPFVPFIVSWLTLNQRHEDQKRLR